MGTPFLGKVACIVCVAYNPEDVSSIWLIENGEYVSFDLIESRFTGKSIVEVADAKDRQKAIIGKNKSATLQAKIDLTKHIEVISNNAVKGKSDIKGIRENRKREQIKTHIDYTKEGSVNE